MSIGDEVNHPTSAARPIEAATAASRFQEELPAILPAAPRSSQRVADMGSFAADGKSQVIQQPLQARCYRDLPLASNESQGFLWGNSAGRYQITCHHDG